VSEPTSDEVRDRLVKRLVQDDALEIIATRLADDDVVSMGEVGEEKP